MRDSGTHTLHERKELNGTAHLKLVTKLRENRCGAIIRSVIVRPQSHSCLKSDKISARDWDLIQSYSGGILVTEIHAHEVKEEPEAITFSEFLESMPPSSFSSISDLAEDLSQEHYEILRPDIQLHCPNGACNGARFFRCTNDHYSLQLSRTGWQYFYMYYRCSNCRKATKIFSLAVEKSIGGNSGHCYKVGEYPLYGPPTPPRLITLIGPDREIFLKGRRCENQGLGIGAFVYYRRVVENQKNRILDQIIKISHKLNIGAEKISTLEAAKAETQFSKALDSVKDAIPQTLLINGQNPLSLLHSALSGGLHDRSDEECLEIASSVRVVLAELSDRLAQALKDEAELNHAISKLMKVKNKG
jgi:hypothetical protein